MNKLILTSILCLGVFSLSANENQIFNSTIFNQIVEQAQEDWPTSYNMQMRQIDSEVKAYIECNKIKKRIQDLKDKEKNG